MQVDTVTLVFINVCTQPAGPPCMPCHGPVLAGAADACMMSLLLRAWWAARPEAASAGTPLGQDGRPSTCAISGPRRPPRTFDTPNCTVSSVPVGWWRSGAANWKTPVDFFYSDMEPGVFMVPRAAGSLLKCTGTSRDDDTCTRSCASGWCSEPARSASLPFLAITV